MTRHREASEKQPPEEKVWFVVVRKQSEHPVHQMRWLLISGERERDQGLKSLIIVQHVERDGGVQIRSRICKATS